MLRRSIFTVAVCGLVAAPALWSVAGSMAASGAMKAGDKAKAPKGNGVSAPVSEGTESGETAAKGSPGEKGADAGAAEEADDDLKPVHKTDREWKRLLSAKEYRVTRQKETELPFSGKYVHSKKEGVYRCVCCGAKLFSSDTKFDSKTGWPSFYAPLNKKGIATAADYSDSAPRVEVTCSRCDAHLGHVFGDGPAPTGLRYCINSVSLKLEESPKSGVKAGGKPQSTPGAKSPTKPAGKKPTPDKGE